MTRSPQHSHHTGWPAAIIAAGCVTLAAPALWPWTIAGVLAVGLVLGPLGVAALIWFWPRRQRH